MRSNKPIGLTSCKKLISPRVYMDVNQTVRAVFGNPIYTAIAIVTIIMIIYYFTVAGHWSGDGVWVAMARFGIYTSLVVGTLVCLHNREYGAIIGTKYGDYEAHKLQEGALGDAVGEVVEPKIGGAEGGAVEGVAGLKPTMIVYGNMPKGMPSGMKLAQPAVAVSPQYQPPQYAPMPGVPMGV